MKRAKMSRSFAYQLRVTSTHSPLSQTSSKPKCTSWFLYFSRHVRHSLPECSQSYLQRSSICSLIYCLCSLLMCFYKRQRKHQTRLHVFFCLFYFVLFILIHLKCWNHQMSHCGFRPVLKTDNPKYKKKKQKKTQLYDFRQTRLITSTLSFGILVSIFRGESDRRFSTAHDDASWLKTDVLDTHAHIKKSECCSERR